MRLDMFPAKVDGYPKARVLVGEKRAQIWVERNGTVEVAAEGEVESFHRATRRGEPSTVTLTDGTVWEIYRATGCGCGSRLKGVRSNGL